MFNQPKKILALDGGGIRGLVTIEVLAKIEKILRDYYGNEKMVLADYFDFIAGTSTGAIISAALAIGMSVDDIRRFYLDSGKDMFDRASWLTRIGSLFGHKYNNKKLAQKLQEVFGEDTTLGSNKLKTLLMVVTHNVRTDSPWPITNNPYAK
ncbi:MAG: patatin-like phospholipase family protein [Candidatus Thiothrix moscowensis]|nr:patatin-like phospholipase family protein [Candidatus Thiothrix moscowensis]